MLLLLLLSLTAVSGKCVFFAAAAFAGAAAVMEWF